MPDCCCVQESPSLARKFLGVLDVPLSVLAAARSSDARACFLAPSPLLAARALWRHRSQWVWFRALFIAFAQCAYVNTLRCVK
jgi:N-acetylglucosaminylphosphatidylinositol deacetylase